MQRAKTERQIMSAGLILDSFALVSDISARVSIQPGQADSAERGFLVSAASLRLWKAKDA